MGALSGKMGAVYKEYTPLDKSKEIANFQSGETWTSGAGTQTDDIVNIRLGTKSIKIADNDASAGLGLSYKASGIKATVASKKSKTI